MPDQCFVIMPYGSKKDPAGRAVDFDALYRLLHAPAIQQAGLVPVRSDQQQESGVIHKQMLEHLRDRSVVLADLSLHNPNVFYELGARHAMAPRGTVLTCEAGTPLPFDINLARVIKYRYDGAELRAADLRAAETELVAQLKAARTGEVDSPIHSLISLDRPGRGTERERALLIKPYEALRLYPEELGRRWGEGKANYHLLKERHADSAFGSRALGYWWLEGADGYLLQSGREIAKALSGNEQFDLAHELYVKLETRRYDELSYKDFIYYGDAASERETTLKGIDEGFRCFARARHCITGTPSLSPAEALSAQAWVDQRTASMQAWKWMLTRNDDDLNAAIQLHERVLEAHARAMSAAKDYYVGSVALCHLRLLALERARARNKHAPDLKNHLNAIASISMAPRHPNDLSHLQWYQAIAAADAGYEQEAARLVERALQTDANGGRSKYQYRHLLRLLDQLGEWLRNESTLAAVRRGLQSASPR